MKRSWVCLTFKKASKFVPWLTYWLNDWEKGNVRWVMHGRWKIEVVKLNSIPSNWFHSLCFKLVTAFGIFVNDVSAKWVSSYRFLCVWFVVMLASADELLFFIYRSVRYCQHVSYMYCKYTCTSCHFKPVRDYEGWEGWGWMRFFRRWEWDWVWPCGKLFRSLFDEVYRKSVHC